MHYIFPLTTPALCGWRGLDLVEGERMADKFAALVHYICDRRSERPDTLGKTKLNKIAWLADRLMYLRRGHPITKETYIKRQYGPVARSMLSVIRQLQNAGTLAVRGVEYFGYDKYEYITLKRPNIEGFSPSEISLIDEIIDVVCDEHTAASISVASHDAVWQCAKIGEELPLYTAFAAVEGEIDEDDMAWADAELDRLGI